MKNNFTQALKELTGFDGEPIVTEKTSSDATESVIIPSVDYETNAQEEIVAYKEYAEKASANSTRVTSTMVIKGNIKSKDDIFINGEVVGDIETSANLHTSNLVIGNVVANNMLANKSRQRGNISLDGDLFMGEGSVIVGNINCNDIDISGKIKGNCDAKGFAKFSKSAYLLGDIISEDFSTEAGAKIVGTITTRTGDLDLDSEFDFGGDF